MTTDLLAQLVAIDSVNPALVPGGAGESEIAAFVAAWLTDRGLEVTVDEPLAGRPSVVAIARGTGGGASLMLNAHLDTVNVEGMQRPHETQLSQSPCSSRPAQEARSQRTFVVKPAVPRDLHRQLRRPSKEVFRTN